MYPIVTTTVKISILCLYRRIFSTQKFRRYFVYVGAVALLWFIAIELVSIMTCLPPKNSGTGILQGFVSITTYSPSPAGY